jgi:predicted transcriptional regulator
LRKRIGEEIMNANIKEEARRLVENLPDDSTWEDLMYQIYVRETIESGLADSEAGRVTDVEEVRKEFGLPA